MYTFVSTTAKLLITSLDPSSSSLLEASNDLIHISNPVVIEKKQFNDTTLDTKSYIGDITVEPYGKMLIDLPKISTIDKEYDAVIKTIESYTSLIADWDGYGGIAPSDEIVATAIELLKEFKTENFEKPKTMLSGSGEIGLYWKNDLMYIEISIDEPKNYSLYIEEGTAYSGKADINISDKLPEELSASLNKFKMA